MYRSKTDRILGLTSIRLIELTHCTLFVIYKKKVRICQDNVVVVNEERDTKKICVLQLIAHAAVVTKFI